MAESLPKPESDKPNEEPTLLDKQKFEIVLIIVVITRQTDIGANLSEIRSYIKEKQDQYDTTLLANLEQKDIKKILKLLVDEEKITEVQTEKKCSYLKK